MIELHEIIKLPEGRRLEFKEKLPTPTDLAKTIVSFANDAGGDVFIGVRDQPREILGIKNIPVLQEEERISNIVFDLCSPVILPEISFIEIENKLIIRIKVYKGNKPPYHLKNKSIEKGTYIRVGSSNRLADFEVISELHRFRQNRSFDSEILIGSNSSDIELSTFSELFQSKLNEPLNPGILRKLSLVKEEQDKEFATNALVLLSDDPIQKVRFPYAKIECARFKGIVSEFFIDKKTISGNVALQTDLAFQFILRYIS